MDWRARARRAEASREAERAIEYTKTLEAETRIRRLERAMDEATQSRSWRLTAPLRRLNRARSDAVGRLRGS